MLCKQSTIRKSFNPMIMILMNGELMNASELLKRYAQMLVGEDLVLDNLGHHHLQ